MIKSLGIVLTLLTFIVNAQESFVYSPYDWGEDSNDQWTAEDNEIVTAQTQDMFNKSYGAPTVPAINAAPIDHSDLAGLAPPLHPPAAADAHLSTMLPPDFVLNLPPVEPITERNEVESDRLDPLWNFTNLEPMDIEVNLPRSVATHAAVIAVPTVSPTTSDKTSPLDSSTQDMFSAISSATLANPYKAPRPARLTTPDKILAIPITAPNTSHQIPPQDPSIHDITPVLPSASLAKPHHMLTQPNEILALTSTAAEKSHKKPPMDFSANDTVRPTPLATTATQSELLPPESPISLTPDMLVPATPSPQNNLLPLETPSLQTHGVATVPSTPATPLLQTKLIIPADSPTSQASGVATLPLLPAISTTLKRSSSEFIEPSEEISRRQRRRRQREYETPQESVASTSTISQDWNAQGISAVATSRLQDDFTSKQTNEKDNKFYCNKTPEELPRSSCSICINDLQMPPRHGLFVDPDTETILYPSLEDYMILGENEEIMITCGASAYLSIEGAYGARKIVAKCEQGNLKFGERELKLAEFQCTAIPKTIIRKVDVKNPETSLCKQYSHYQVGFQLRVFNVLYDLCVDEANYETIFVRNEMDHKVFKSESMRHAVKTTSNLPGDIEAFKAIGKDLENFYRRPYQTRKLTTKLGPEKFAELTQGNTCFITKCHLVGKSDFVFRSEQFGALYYPNIKPMWSNLSFNNWAEVRFAIRQFVINRVDSLTIYSGSSLQQTHQDSEGNTRELYLGKINVKDTHLGTAEEKQIGKFPKLFWKILHDPKSLACVAIIGENTAYEINDEDKACDDVTKDILWLRERLNAGMKYGIVYACSCSGERSFLPEELPRLTVTDILKV